MKNTTQTEANAVPQSRDPLSELTCSVPFINPLIAVGTALIGPIVKLFRRPATPSPAPAAVESPVRYRYRTIPARQEQAMKGCRKDAERMKKGRTERARRLPSRDRVVLAQSAQLNFNHGGLHHG
jgi:hypothetical protein